jgi:hypothetical protein
MSFKLPFLLGFFAAKTGTETMSDSSIYPPGRPPPVFYSDGHYEGYLPSERATTSMASRTEFRT